MAEIRQQLEEYLLDNLLNNWNLSALAQDFSNIKIDDIAALCLKGKTGKTTEFLQYGKANKLKVGD